MVRVVGSKKNLPSESVCANKPGWLSTEMVAPRMGLLEAASTTVPDAAGETYVVISMQPLSDIRSGRAALYRHFLMRRLTVKLGAGTRSATTGICDQTCRQEVWLTERDEMTTPHLLC